MLRFLRVLDPDSCGIVKWMGFFKHGPHVCLVFELLKQSLMDFAMLTANHTLPLRQIKHILEQVRLDLQPNLNCVESQHNCTVVVALGTKYNVVFCVLLRVSYCV
jgi:hypothetical protein